MVRTRETGKDTEIKMNGVTIMINMGVNCRNGSGHLKLFFFKSEKGNY